MNTIEPRPTERERNSYLDILRSVAAFVVLFDHLRNAFFLPYRQTPTSNPIGDSLLIRLIYMDHYYARVAVIVFFPLSGYLVGDSILRSMSRGIWSWADYLVNRMTRLYVVLIPALCLTAFFDFVGRNNNLSARTYFMPDALSHESLASQDTLRAFIGTAFLYKTFLREFSER